jgi:formate hydrogenlyase subunit 3/multisubunit Na+/H+ antiporter MnhD subunit
MILAVTVGMTEAGAGTQGIAGEQSWGNSWVIYGRSLTLTAQLQAVLLFVYLGLGLLFLLSLLFPQDTIYIPATLTAVAIMAVALMAQPNVVGAVLILITSATLAILIQGERPGSTLASIRHLSMAALALPMLLMSSWMLESFQMQLMSTITLLLLGAILILFAAFPFHIWVSQAVTESRPLVPAVVFGLIALMVAVFSLRLLVTNPVIFGNSLFLTILRGSGVVTLLVASLLVLTAKTFSRMLGYLLLLDIGATVIAFGFGGSVAREAVILFIVLRTVGLIIAGVGLNLIQRQIVPITNGDNQMVASRGLARRTPLGVALFIYGGLSLAGVPLTPGFAGRWTLVAAPNPSSGISTIILVIAVAVGAAALFRMLPQSLASDGQNSAETNPESTISRLVAGLLLASGIILAFFPQIALSIAHALTHSF